MYSISPTMLEFLKCYSKGGTVGNNNHVQQKKQMLQLIVLDYAIKNAHVLQMKQTVESMMHVKYKGFFYYLL